MAAIQHAEISVRVVELLWLTKIFLWYRKLVIIGDGACGKTSLLSVFTLGYFPTVSWNNLLLLQRPRVLLQTLLTCGVALRAPTSFFAYHWSLQSCSQFFLGAYCFRKLCDRLQSMKFLSLRIPIQSWLLTWPQTGRRKICSARFMGYRWPGGLRGLFWSVVLTSYYSHNRIETTTLSLC